MKQHPAVSIVVPTLNEAENLPLLFARIDTALQAARIPYEIIVVDDHSNDGTQSVAEKADPKYNVKLETKLGKRGKAYSLLQGFQSAQYDLICMIDADLQYPPESIPSMYHKMQFCNADVVITNRIDNETSLARKLASGAFHLVFTKALFGINYDTQSGLKLFKKEVLQNITLKPSAWTFDLEFIIRSLENQYTILSEDIPFGKRYAGEAKISLFSAAFEGAWQSIKLWRSASVGRVKSQYRHLEPLQRSSISGSFAGIAGLIIAGAFALSLVTSHPATALSLPQVAHPTLIATENPVSKALHDITPSDSSSKDTGTTTSSQDSANNSSIPAKSSTTSTSTPATGTSSSTGTATTSSPAGTTAKTSTSQQSNPTAAGTNPSTLTAETGKNAAYYPNSKLASSKTSQFLKLSKLVLEVGAAFVILGILVISTKKVRARGRQQQPIWNN